MINRAHLFVCVLKIFLFYPLSQRLSILPPPPQFTSELSFYKNCEWNNSLDYKPLYMTKILYNSLEPNLKHLNSYDDVHGFFRFLTSNSYNGDQ